MARRKKTVGRKKTAGKRNSTGPMLARAQALAARDLPGAVLTWGRVLDRDPGNARALAALRGLDVAQRRALIGDCRALVRNGATAHALALSGILARACPADPALAAFEARALCVADRPRDALDRLAPLLARHPDHPGLCCSHGIALAFAGDHAGAAAVLGGLQDSGALDAEAINVLGSSLAFLGRMEEAQEVLLRAARRGALAVAGLYNLSRHADLTREPEVIAQLQAALADPALPRSDHEMAAYALARLAEQLGETDAAFRCLALANALKPDAEIARYMAMIRATATRAPALAAAMTAPACAPAEPCPVFIVGMPRSGTTLAEQILLRHSRVASIGESPRLAEVYTQLRDSGARIDADSFREAYLQAIPPDCRGASVVLDKMPPNAFLCGLALKAIPGARVIHCRRHPMATGFSAFRLRFAEGYGYAHRFATIAEFYRLTEGAMADWRRSFPDRIMALPYEPLTEAPARWIAAMLEFCGLEREDGLTEFRGSSATVRTASLGQVRRGIYRGSSEGWKPYADHLAPLMAELIGEIAEYEVEIEQMIASQRHPVSGAA
ncbi:tetratricopeptide repeat-containing sulfotransferase family protein [Mangrovicoccus algicola]|uniref:Sulfotransferase n=1 Tax=Mangrovicoccus algicola TaxID=2771008 RepID=A0A8J6YVW2_9RHOB|nr:sulfotransferase family protein [Mangrovicoccus algicola]MBE3637174.1 sulfotransferase [Mangrovicoccus algicola]